MYVNGSNTDDSFTMAVSNSESLTKKKSHSCRHNFNNNIWDNLE